MRDCSIKRVLFCESKLELGHDLASGTACFLPPVVMITEEHLATQINRCPMGRFCADQQAFFLFRLLPIVMH